MSVTFAPYGPVGVAFQWPVLSALEPTPPAPPPPPARPASWLSVADRTRIAEEAFGAPLVAVHEAAHAAAAVLLGVQLVAVVADGDFGLTSVLTARDDLGDQQRLAVTVGAAAALYERMELGTDGCQDDIDRVAVFESHYTRCTGSYFATWAASRQLVREPVFGTALVRVIPLLASGRVVPGEEIVAALADLPRVTINGIPPVVAANVPAPAPAPEVAADSYAI